MSKRVRVLHVLGGLERGGAETWIVQLFEKIQDDRIEMDVLVNKEGGPYVQRIKKRGARILSIGYPTNIVGYQRRLKRLLVSEGPYDVVHSHLQLFSGVILRCAYYANVSGRIAHIRNSFDGKSNSPYRSIYRAVMKSWLKKYATHFFAVSRTAAVSTFGEEYLKAGSVRIMTGIDLSPFLALYDKKDACNKLGLEPSPLIIGHIGGFREQKNHEFIVEVADRLRSIISEFKVVLVGTGEKRNSLEAMINGRGLSRYFTFLGEREDVADIYKCFDVFLLPSLYEGLPRVLIEAQVSGIPCLASNRITSEAAASLNSVRFLSIYDGPGIWVDSIVDIYRTGSQRVDGYEAARSFDSQGMSIEANARELAKVYIEISNRSDQ